MKINPEIIYIAGYGRSGSTVLDIILDNSPDIIGLGETVSIELVKNDINKCSCGKELLHCPFYKQVFNLESKFTLNTIREFVKTCRAIEHRKNAINIFFNRHDPCLLKNYKEYMDSFWRSLIIKTGKNTFVDSSKTAPGATWRPLAIYRYCGYNLKMIHLVRDGRAVLRSILRGSNQALGKGYEAKLLLPFIRAVYGWITANLIAMIEGMCIGKDKYLRVKYEDLMQNPSKTLEEIQEFLEIDLSSVINKIVDRKPLTVGHMLGGNRLRFNKTIYLNFDEEWKVKLPIIYQIFFWLTGGILAFILGYKIKTDNKNN